MDMKYCAGSLLTDRQWRRGQQGQQVQGEHRGQLGRGGGLRTESCK
jgi:hypothetical protein